MEALIAGLLIFALVVVLCSLPGSSTRQGNPPDRVIYTSQGKVRNGSLLKK